MNGPAARMRPRTNPPWAIRCVFALATCALGQAIAADLSAGPSYPYFRQIANNASREQARLLLAAGMVDGRESKTSIALRRDRSDTEYGVSLESLVKALDLDISTIEGGAFAIETPLGRATFSAAETTSDRGATFVALPLAATRLGCRLRFDEGEFALVIDTPWRDLANTPARQAKPLAIDVHAPNASLSRWRSETISQSNGGDVTTSAITDLGGALGSGYWQAQVLDGIERRPRINELVWVLDKGPARWLFGQQRVAVNPLLPGFDLSGAQMAYTNSPEYLYSQAPLSGQLVPYAANPLTVLRGEGPPGGIAELQLDGQMLMRQTIGLDGRYEFRNVPASPVNAIRLEVAIFEFRDIDVPTRVDRVYSQASNLQLPEGTWVSFAGAGLNGRRLDSSDAARGSAGFYQFRYGVNSSLSVDAVVQGVDDRRYGSLGAAASLGPLGAWAAYAARNSAGAGAWNILGDGGRNGWFWHAYAQHLDAGFIEGQDATDLDATAATESTFAEVGRALGSSARVSVVHGTLNDAANGNLEYTKLAADWRPFQSLSLSARPDYRGEYSYSASWYPAARAHVSLTRYKDRSETAAEYDLNPAYRLMATHLHQQDVGNRAGLFLKRQPFGVRRANWTLGALSANDALGYYFEGAMEVRPGLSARLNVLKDPLIQGSGTSSPTVTLNVVADFAVTGSGLARGGYNVALQQIGGISGALGGDLPPGLGRDTLAHVGVSVNGQLRTETDASGHFYLGDLKPGVYRIGLEPDNLPIELSASGAARNVEVRSGANTRVDFGLELRLGCAGRVEGHGDSAGLRIAILGSDGQLVTQVRPSASGFYRVDALAPGRYRIELRTADTGATLASLPMALTDRFVFGQDFRKGAPAGEAPAATPDPQP
ncbi:MAG: hypothetical protein IPF61_05005 [Xanthomonadales bacterium]|nr:hypothetical protein [Xanthomonadales bacterium]